MAVAEWYPLILVDRPIFLFHHQLSEQINSSKMITKEIGSLHLPVVSFHLSKKKKLVEMNSQIEFQYASAVNV